MVILSKQFVYGTIPFVENMSIHFKVPLLILCQKLSMHSRRRSKSRIIREMPPPELSKYELVVEIHYSLTTHIVIKR